MARSMPCKYLSSEFEKLQALNVAGVCLSGHQSPVICYIDSQDANIW